MIQIHFPVYLAHSEKIYGCNSTIPNIRILAIIREEYYHGRYGKEEGRNKNIWDALRYLCGEY
jgi:hypothetical protein